MKDTTVPVPQKQDTLVLIKPHVFRDAAASPDAVMASILSAYLANGLVLKGISRIAMSEELIGQFYKEHVLAPYFNELKESMLVGPVIALWLSGQDAVAKVRTINGATNPLEAAEGTLRHKYGHKRKGPYNAVHGSDSPESAKRELTLLFNNRGLAPLESHRW